MLRTYHIETPLGSIGNTEWWTRKDWEKHRERIARLKREGTYGQPVSHKVVVEECSLLDTHEDGVATESCRLIILDFSNK